MPEGIAGLASDGPQGTEIWLANITGSDIQLGFESASNAAVLDPYSFIAARHDPAFLDTTVAVTGPLAMAAYAVARVINAAI